MVSKIRVLRYHRCVFDNSVLLWIVAPTGHSSRTFRSLTMCGLFALEESVKNCPLTRRRYPRNVIILKHLDPWKWRCCFLCKRLEPITQSHGVTSRKNGVFETKDLVHEDTGSYPGRMESSRQKISYTKTRRHIPGEWSRRDERSRTQRHGVIPRKNGVFETKDLVHKDTGSYPGRMESSRQKISYTKTRRHIPEEWSRRDKRSRTQRRVMTTKETCGVWAITNWWINRSAHDIAWCWRNC
jgi:hypothetical protein